MTAPGFGLLSPEVFVVAAENTAAQGEGGVGTANDRVHSRAPQASKHRAAAGLHPSRAHARALLSEPPQKQAV